MNWISNKQYKSLQNYFHHVESRGDKKGDKPFQQIKRQKTRSLHLNRLHFYMSIPLKLLIFVCSIYAAALGAQTNFRSGWEAANPVAPLPVLRIGEKVKIHQGYLDQASREGDALKRLYGFLYLFEDYLDDHDFSKAAEYLLEAETLVNNSRISGWQGFVAFRRGVLNLRLKNYKQAIPYYETAATLCAAAGDSMCMGESFGQISAMYGLTGDYSQARQYFESALPLITRYGTQARLASLFDNFGNLLSDQGHPAEAVLYFEKALHTVENDEDKRQATIFRNNLAGAHYHLQQYDQALKIYQACIQLGEEKNWKEDLIYNYAGISGVYERTGHYREALHFFKKYQSLQDSLIGTNTQGKIADLEARYHRQQQEIKLQKSNSELATARLSLERGALSFLILFLLLAVALWRWRLQQQQAKREKAQNQENLKNITRLLLEKNARIVVLEEQVQAVVNPIPVKTDPEEFEKNLFDQRILTEDDWIAFKTYFEKVYPGYIQRLRSTYTDISDAEKRLFLFIKLHLDRKEAATMLGISVDSVKRTRNRLRKRLGLGEDVELETYIHAF